MEDEVKILLQEIADQMMEWYTDRDMPEALGWHERIDKVIKQYPKGD